MRKDRRQKIPREDSCCRAVYGLPSFVFLFPSLAGMRSVATRDSLCSITSSIHLHESPILIDTSAISSDALVIGQFAIPRFQTVLLDGNIVCVVCESSRRSLEARQVSAAVRRCSPDRQHGPAPELSLMEMLAAAG